MVKMPASNIAKVFGPTIVGYSSAEPEQHAIFTETIIQASVMEKLLQIPADYWCRYLVVSSSASTQSDAAACSAAPSSTDGAEPSGQYFGKCWWNVVGEGRPGLLKSDGCGLHTGTPSVRKTGRKNKFYATPPYTTIVKATK